MFLSAIGLYYSFSKDENILTFYKRRILRVFPAFLIIVVPWFYYYDVWKKGNYAWFFGHITTIGYWFKGAGDWFISAIVLLYFLYPFLYKYLYKNNTKYPYLKLISLYSIIILYLKYFFPDYSPSLSQFLTRIPIFLAGMFVAPYVKESYLLSKKKTLIYVLINLVIFLSFYGYLVLKGYQYNFIGRLTFFPISLSLIILIACFYKESSCLFNRFIVFIGSLSLEIYLTNERTISVSENIGKYFDFNQSLIVITLENVIGILLCLVLSYLVHILTAKKYIINDNNVYYKSSKNDYDLTVNDYDVIKSLNINLEETDTARN